MKTGLFVYAVLAAVAVPTVALADDPNDPAMRTAAARLRDREIIRQLNRDELARVRERDAGYAEGWQAYRDRAGPAAVDPGYSRQSQDYARAQADYARDRAAYQRDLARWRRAVAACRAGDYSACED
ncbi:MAG: hypothetical protein ACTHLU_07735 [Novosphingobium sp.]